MESVKAVKMEHMIVTAPIMLADVTARMKAFEVKAVVTSGIATSTGLNWWLTLQVAREVCGFMLMVCGDIWMTQMLESKILYRKRLFLPRPS